MTGHIAYQRIQREYNDILKSTDLSQHGIELSIVSDDLTQLKGRIFGPPETPYEGGIFFLEILIPETYPFSPPKVRFVTKIWHPNISSVTGAICLDILKDQWAAAMSLRTVMLSLQALLASPEPNDPQDAVVARQFSDKPDLFSLTAKYWTKFHAGSKYSNPDYDQLVERLVDMGVSKPAALVALSTTDWNIGQATEHLFS